jgi:hypothetical protein
MARYPRRNRNAPIDDGAIAFQIACASVRPRRRAGRRRWCFPQRHTPNARAPIASGAAMRALIGAVARPFGRIIRMRRIQDWSNRP